MSEIVAYREKPSMSCDGTMRWEYMVRRVEDVNPDVLTLAWGKSWMYHRSDITHVLTERRFLIGGPPEQGWCMPVGLTLREDVLDHLPKHSVIVDPKLQVIEEATRAERARDAAREAADAEEKVRIDHESEMHRYRQKRSNAAFERLLASKDGNWAERWNAFAQSCSKEFLASVGEVAEFRRLYDAAMGAETVPAKRKAIKAFLAYAEPMLAKHEKV